MKNIRTYNFFKIYEIKTYRLNIQFVNAAKDGNINIIKKLIKKSKY